MKTHAMQHLLNVDDVKRSIAFYEQYLGFDTGNYWEQNGSAWAEMRQGDIRFMLNGRVDMTRDSSNKAARQQRSTYTDAVFYFYVDDVDALHDTMKADGLAVTGVEDEFYGMREFYVRDPDGYELGIGSPITQPVLKVKKRAGAE